MMGFLEMDSHRHWGHQVGATGRAAPVVSGGSDSGRSFKTAVPPPIVGAPRPILGQYRWGIPQRVMTPAQCMWAVAACHLSFPVGASQGVFYTPLHLWGRAAM